MTIVPTIPEIVAVIVILVSYALVARLVHAVMVHLQYARDGVPLWTLSQALSDKVEQPDPADPAKTVIIYTPSSSRLIAFMGTMVIMVLFMAVGAATVWMSVTSNTMPDLDKIGWFFGIGASLFVPYAVNRIADGMKAIGAAFGRK